MIKKIIKIIGIFVLTIIVLFVGLIGYLAVTEFKPEEIMNLEIENKQSTKVNTDDEYKMMIWNLGYCALGENTDFFMDGGKMVNTATKEEVINNLEGITKTIKDENLDFLMLQEVDVSSTRSKKINEVEYIKEHLEVFSSSFASNFKVNFLPYPIPPIGKVYSGVQTLSKYEVTDSFRKSLPVPFKWPVSMVNLKRCLNISYLPIDGSEKKLVLINLHLEAYDDGEGKIEQTKVLKSILEDEYEKGNYVIAGGDFNQTFKDYKDVYNSDNAPWKPGIIDLDDFDHFHPVADSSYPTCRSLETIYKGSNKDTFNYYLIDGYIISDNIELEEIHTLNLDFVYSDHNPVVLNFKLHK